MKKNLRSACLFILVFLSFIVGLAGMGSAGNDSYNYSFNEKNYTGKWGNLSSPTSEYNIWGYPDKNYTFTTTYNNSLFSNKRVIVFYWDCKNNTSDHTPPIQMSIKNCTSENGAYHSNYAHKWDKNGTYYVSVAIFQDGTPINISYWTPVVIRDNCTIKVQNFFMLEGNEGSGCNKTYNVLIPANSTENSENSSNSSDIYCGYVGNGYSFNVILNATFINTNNLTSEDNRTINETTTEINWGDSNSDNSLSTDNNFTIKSNKTIHETYAVISAGNFPHQWNQNHIGENEINASGFYWDPLDGNRSSSNNNTTNILIIRDPKNLVSYPIIGNLQNWGIFLSVLGLIIFYFTYTRNNVPIKIALFGMKPFYLKSVNSLTGTLTFVAGMYLCFVFGRCPWDIPIVSSLNWLSNMYFNMLYHEYVTKPRFDIPYLSILIGLLDVIILSLIIHLIAIPFYKGEFKTGEFLRKKISSASAQPEMISYSVENKTNQEN